MSTLRAPSSAIVVERHQEVLLVLELLPDERSASRWFGETSYGSASTPSRSGSPSQSSTAWTPRRLRSRIASA